MFMIGTKLNIFEVLKEHFIKLNKNNMACCPLHKEKTPSFKIYPETNSFYCFGCGVGGDAINLKSHLTGRSNNEVYKEIMTNNKIELTRKKKLQLKAQKKSQNNETFFESWKDNTEIELIQTRRGLEEEIRNISTAIDTNIDRETYNLFMNLLEPKITQLIYIEYELAMLTINPTQFYIFLSKNESYNNKYFNHRLGRELVQ